MSKTDLRARPMFHHTKDAIEAHLTIVFTALAVSREIQTAPARDPQPHPTTVTTALSHYRDQRHRTDLSTCHPHRQASHPRRDEPATAQA
jgi:hypothetical protein